jgi:hypothetical protein
VPYNALSRSVPGIIAYCSVRFSAGCPQDIRIYVDNLVNTGDNPATIGDNLHCVRDLLTVQDIASIVGCYHSLLINRLRRAYAGAELWLSRVVEKERVCNLCMFQTP